MHQRRYTCGTLPAGFAGPFRHNVTCKHRRGPLRLVPLHSRIDSLRNYRLSDFRAHFIAGLTVATVAVPQAMAYALVAGVPPEYGLYTAIIMKAVRADFRLLASTH